MSASPADRVEVEEDKDEKEEEEEEEDDDEDEDDENDDEEEEEDFDKSTSSTEKIVTRSVIKLVLNHTKLFRSTGSNFALIEILISPERDMGGSNLQ